MVESTTSSVPGVREIAARTVSGDLSGREVVEEHIHRIEEVNLRLNAVVVPLFDRALGGGIEYPRLAGRLLARDPLVPGPAQR